MIASILSNFCKNKASSLVLMLNFDLKEIDIINEELKNTFSQKFLQIKNINEELTTKRSDLYLQGHYNITFLLILKARRFILFIWSCMHFGSITKNNPNSINYTSNY